MFNYKKMRNNRHISKKKGYKVMKKLICLMVASLMLVFTACGGNGRNDANDTNNGVVQDGDGMIDETGDDNIVDDTADGANDIVNGATDMVDDAANGVENAVDDMTDGGKKNNK